MLAFRIDKRSDRPSIKVQHITFIYQAKVTKTSKYKIKEQRKQHTKWMLSTVNKEKKRKEMRVSFKNGSTDRKIRNVSKNTRSDDDTIG